MLNIRRSDGLGGSLSVSLSLRLGTTKHIKHSKFNLLFFSMVIMLLCVPNVRNLSAFSLTLALQRSNEYKNIKAPFMRQYFYVPSQNTFFCRKILFLIFISNMITWLLSILLLSGEFEINPEPDSVEGSADYSSDVTTTSL